MPERVPRCSNCDEPVQRYVWEITELGSVQEVVACKCERRRVENRESGPQVTSENVPESWGDLMPWLD